MMGNSKEKQRILTGDRPTGKLHLGHYVGSIKNRVKLQDKYDSFFIIADLQVYTDQIHKAKDVKNNIYELMADYLALGLKETNTFFIQSQVPELTELTTYLTFITDYARLKRNPTLKTEIKMYGTKSMSLGFLTYPVSQASDILAFNPDLVPVGKDQVPHIELTRELARKFNKQFAKSFKIPKALVGDVPTLVGIDGQDKMSKSLDNAIFFADSDEQIRKQVMRMYTDPNRIRATDPGKIEGNPLFIYHRLFNPDEDEVLKFEKRYKKGAVGDIEVKERLAEVLIDLITPIRKRREKYIKDKGKIDLILKRGIENARDVANGTVSKVRDGLGIGYGNKFR